MSTAELKTLANIIRATWKELALRDQADAAEMVDIIKTTLESLEALEAE